MLHQRSRRADGVRWSHAHPCVREAAVQPDYWVLLAITLHCKSCLRVYVSRHSPHSSRQASPERQWPRTCGTKTQLVDLPSVSQRASSRPGAGHN